MRAAHMFASGLRDDNLLGQTVSVRVELFGSLGATGKGHGSDKAILLGLKGEAPESTAEIGMEHNLGLTCDPIGGLEGDGRSAFFPYSGTK